ncbi:hypothetical protein [Faecalibacillus intestinalis]|uniref:hypothetical protein n=1 Tax=Faecalibacillus intestinalis TaxID=1982626 RepID=UPI00399201EB
MENLKDKIRNLIELKTEGDYWDFKQEWYKNKEIYCMILFVWQIILQIRMLIL